MGAIGVHAGEEDFACAAAPDFAGPFDRVEADGRAAAVGVNAPFARTFALGIDRDDDALAAEGFGACVDQPRIFHCGGVDANLVRAGEQHFAHVIDRADAAADRERDETMFGGAAHDIDHRAALVGRGGDVEKDQLVRLLRVVSHRAFDRIAGVDEVDKIHALDHAAISDIEAGDDSFREHGRSFDHRLALRKW